MRLSGGVRGNMGKVRGGRKTCEEVQPRKKKINGDRNISLKKDPVIKEFRGRVAFQGGK